VSDARPPGTEPSVDPHLPDPEGEFAVDPPPEGWVPETSGTSGATASATERAQRSQGPRQTQPGQLEPGHPVEGPGSPPRNRPGVAATAPGLDDRERSLAPKVVTSWRIGTLVSLLLPTIVLSTLGFVFLEAWGWVMLGSLIALNLFLALWYAPARYKRWRWQLTELAVELRFGVIVRQQETVPYFRIQQIDIVQGPLDRVLDLATLQVTTASASGSASLPGIANDDAPTVRAELLARAAAAVADHPGDLRDAV
jgi:uncharacterized protein